MKLRPYQSDLINEVKNKFAAGKKRVILCAPTGAGKTVMFTTMVSQMVAKQKHTRCLIVTDRVELLKQTYGSIDNSGTKAEIYNAKVDKDIPVTSRVVVAMVETIKRRHKSGSLKIGNFDLIIIDEAHKGNFKKLFEIYPNSYYVGATATPIATSKKEPLKMFWDDIAFKVDVPDLINQGYLVGIHPFAMTAINYDNLKKSYSKGDYTEASQYSEFEKPAVFAGLLKAWKKHAVDKKTIVFCVNIEHTINTACDFVEAGFSAVYITSKSSSAERQLAIEKFHSGKAQIMVNCGILTTGYDHPAIECVIMNRATMSEPLWMQCCGRGSRLYQGKDEFILIDMGGNSERNGQWDDERPWIDWFHNPKKAGRSQPAPVKDCPMCDSMIPVRLMVCPYCDYKYPIPEGKELVEGVLVELRAAPADLLGKYIGELTLDELMQLMKSKRYSAEFIYRAVRSRGESALSHFAKIAGYKKGWVYYQMGQPKNFFNIKIT